MNSGEAFIDEATLSVSAGKGGDGCVSMLREKFVPFGGPDGGDGGRGGDVVIVATRNLATLQDQRMRRAVRAEAGVDGAGRNKTGRDGKSVEIKVPVGTIVTEIAGESEDIPVADLTRDGQRVVVARGGRGGAGNTRFKTATRQAPDFAKPGRPGESRMLRFSLKLIADVGLLGFPNAGKSTLLRRISAAKPRVAAYPFTTLVPSLGVVEVDERRFVVADIPGLIEGASDGAGLGGRFLRHVERTRVLLHLLDAGALVLEDDDLVVRYDAIRKELGAHEPALLERDEIVVLNKVDLVADREALDSVERTLRARGRDVFRVSGATGEGIEAMIRAVALRIAQLERETVLDAESEPGSTGLAAPENASERKGAS
jgi:GTP-binding protein